MLRLFSIIALFALSAGFAEAGPVGGIRGQLSRGVGTNTGHNHSVNRNFRFNTRFYGNNFAYGSAYSTGAVLPLQVDYAPQQAIYALPAQTYAAAPCPAQVYAAPQPCQALAYSAPPPCYGQTYSAPYSDPGLYLSPASYALSSYVYGSYGTRLYNYGRGFGGYGSGAHRGGFRR